MVVIRYCKLLIYFLLIYSGLIFTINAYGENIPDVNMEYFNNIIAQTTFDKDTSVIWYPEIPTYNDEIVILYNTAAKFSKCKENDNLTFVFYPYGDPKASMEKDMSKGKDGIFYCVLEKSEIKGPGYICFKIQGKSMDSFFGSPWKLPVTDTLPQYRKVETKYLNYYYLSEDKDTDAGIKTITYNADNIIARLQNITGLSFTRKINYYYYYKRELVMKYQANFGNNCENYRNRAYSCEYKNTADTHELTHLLFQQLGNHVGIFDEGVAIYFGQDLLANGWRSHSSDWWAQKFQKEGKLPELSEIIPSHKFYNTANPADVLNINYPVAGSFTSFIIKRYGFDQFKSLFTQINDDNQYDLDAVNNILQSIYGKNIEALEGEWIHYIEGIKI